MSSGLGYTFDRRASPVILDALAEGGALRGLVERRSADPYLLDVQIRRNPVHVGLYAGLSRILRVQESRGRFRLSSDGTYKKLAGFDPAWDDWMTGEALLDAWPRIDAYIQAILDDETVLPRLTNREGVVHAALASGTDPTFRVIQREAGPAFADQATKDLVMSRLTESVHAAMTSTGRTDPWWPGVRDNGVMPSLGAKADALAVDDRGRLLVIEAKPSNEVKGIAWAPAQVLIYSSLFAGLAADPDAVGILDTMLTDRISVGLTREGDSLTVPLEVVPVVAIGAGPRSPAALPRLRAVHDALADVWDEAGVSPLEVWLLNDQGVIAQRWRPAEGPFEAPKDESPATATTERFVTAARRAATGWKSSASALSDAAKAPFPYRGSGPALPFCVPVDVAEENLLPDARAVALERFAAAGIPWHHGIAAGPSNHLLSSQVQCANALAPLVDRPDDLQRLFTPHLPIAEVVPFGALTSSPFDRSDHVVFEWNGLTDYLGERGGVEGSRGANSTSVDAAIRYRTPSGDIEIALIEWKYTEQYVDHRLSGGASSMQVRQERYRHLFDHPASPIRTDAVAYEALFAEPLYQLMRQQLLAWQMEEAGELDARRVRAAVVAPSLNYELAASYDTRLARSLGLTDGVGVHVLWRQLLRRPDRFVFIDSANLVLDSSPLPSEFKERYGHLAGGHRTVEEVQPPEPGKVVSAASRARMILERVSGEGGVLEQVARLDERAIADLDPWFARHLLDRLESVAEDVRRLRAEELARLLGETEA